MGEHSTDHRSAVQASLPKQPALVIALAHFFSFIFHPLFIPVLGGIYIAFWQPGYFMGVPVKEKTMVVLRMVLNTLFFPAVTVLLLKGLGFIKSVFLKTQRDRIIPIVASNFFYFWMFLVFKNHEATPPVLTGFMFGIFLSSSAALLANIYFKISLHALGMGSLCGLVLVIIFSSFSYPVFLPAMLIFLLTGLVCTSRLLVSDHTTFDISSGILISILCQLIGALLWG